MAAKQKVTKVVKVTTSKKSKTKVVNTGNKRGNQKRCPSCGRFM